jgi:6,7-dimethyl-8-ribityllumazine synthase
MTTVRRPRVLLVEARFYEDLADELVAGAGAEFDAAGVDYVRLAVPGCFELPAAIAMALEPPQAGASTSAFDGFVAMGVVIEGETDHYDHICREVSRALMDLSVDHRIPLGFGVLTCRTYAQAEERARVSGKNKGADAARACLRMMALSSGRDRIGG